MAGMTCLGIGLLVVRVALPAESVWTRDGIGTALLLVAASIFFVVVFEALPGIGKNAIGTVASILTAIFVYAGTIVILARENSLLMGVILMFTFYLISTGIVVVWVIGLYRSTSNGRS